MTATEFLGQLDTVVLTTVLSLGTGSFLTGYLVGKKIAALRRTIMSSI